MDRRVSKLKETIDSHIGRADWSLEDACRDLKLEITPAYVAQLFKHDTGQGVREYAKRKRLLIAAEQLRTTNLPLKAENVASFFLTVPFCASRGSTGSGRGMKPQDHKASRWKFVWG